MGTVVPLRGREPEPWRLQLSDSTSAPRARQEFEDYLRMHGGPGDDYAGAAVIFGEIVANVVVHAPGPIEIVVDWPDGRATMHVTDDGPPISLDTPMPSPLADHGRGVPLVRRLARGVSTEVYAGAGKTVNVVLPVRARR
jgi:anti-sigma regulatory factor (Ser/Thr protein kinase)